MTVIFARTSDRRRVLISFEIGSSPSPVDVWIATIPRQTARRARQEKLKASFDFAALAALLQ
jgi:hypothetical protein